MRDPTLNLSLTTLAATCQPSPLQRRRSRRCHARGGGARGLRALCLHQIFVSAVAAAPDEVLGEQRLPIELVSPTRYLMPDLCVVAHALECEPLIVLDRPEVEEGDAPMGIVLTVADLCRRRPGRIEALP